MLEICISVPGELSCADGSPTGRGGYFIERAGNEPSEDNYADRGCGSQCGLRVGPTALRICDGRAFVGRRRVAVRGQRRPARRRDICVADDRARADRSGRAGDAALAFA